VRSPPNADTFRHSDDIAVQAFIAFDYSADSDPESGFSAATDLPARISPRNDTPQEESGSSVQHRLDEWAAVAS